MVVMLIALVVMGPEKLPDAARQLGKGMRELRRASSMFSDMFMLEEPPTPKKQAAPPASPGASAPYASGQGASVARGAQTHAPTRPVLLASMRRPTHIESVPLRPCQQQARHQALCVSVELAAARGVER